MHLDRASILDMKKEVDALSIEQFYWFLFDKLPKDGSLSAIVSSPGGINRIPPERALGIKKILANTFPSFNFSNDYAVRQMCRVIAARASQVR